LHRPVLFAGWSAAKHCKVMLTALERIIGFGDGSTLPVMETDLPHRRGDLLGELHAPLRTAMYGKGIQLYCAPTVDDREVWQSTMRHIAVEGRCYVLAACQYARFGDSPREVIRGGSVIVGPLGEVLAGPVYDAEAMLMAEVNLDRIAEGKFDLDVVGTPRGQMCFSCGWTRRRGQRCGPCRKKNHEVDGALRGGNRLHGMPVRPGRRHNLGRTETVA
jgi:hypothetical protein